MRKFTLLLFFVVLWSFSYAQMGEEQYFVDIHGDLRYESRDRFQASLSTNIFGDKVYKDNRGNEVKYSKAMWEKVPGKDRPYFEDFLFSELIHKYRDRRNVKEVYEIDIFGDARYRNNQGQSMTLRRNIMGELEYFSNEFRATLGKDIFENIIYKDNRGNKVTYSKEFLGKIRRGRHRGDGNVEEFLLLGLAKDVGKKKNYTEEYTVDIFGNIEYKNSEGRRVSIKKDLFDDFEYKDNQGVSLSIRKDIFDHVQVNDGRGNKVDAGRDIFGDLQVKDNKGNKWSVERDIFGDLKFRHNYKECATLKKNIFDEREYSDNKGNKVKYSKEAWDKMIKRYGDDEKVFSMLLKKFFVEYR